MYCVSEPLYFQKISFTMSNCTFLQVMTYKNFALDHFLEGCLKYNPKIVRIGQAGNEKLSSINLRNVSSFKNKVELKHTF